MKTLYVAFTLITILCVGCKKAETNPNNGYTCNNGSCEISSNPQFITYADCQTGCSGGSGGTGGYNCTSGTCKSVSSNAQYSTYTNCYNSCGSHPQYGTLKVSGSTSCRAINAWYPYMTVTLSGVITGTDQFTLSGSQTHTQVPVGTVTYHATDVSCSSNVRDGSVQIISGQYAYITVNF